MRRVITPLLLAAGVVLATTSALLAQTSAYQAESEVERLLEDSRSYYENLELERADESLARAIRLGRDFNLRTRPYAETFLLRGILVHVREKDEAGAIADFMEALRIDAGVELDELVRTPTLERLFREAKDRVSRERPVTPPPAESGPAAAPIGTDLMHVPPRGARPGEPVSLVVDPSARLNPQIFRVYLFFKTDQGKATQKLEMRPEGTRSFGARVPARFVSGEQLSYYINAEDRSGRVLASVGSSREPIRLDLTGRKGAAVAPVDELPSGGSLDGFDDDEDTHPLVSITVSVGTGTGYITDKAKPENASSARSAGEPNPKITPGFALAPFHTLIELDFWIVERLSLGAYARIQIVEFAHLEGGRIQFVAAKEGAHALTVRAGGGYGHVRHLVDMNGRLDTTLEGPIHYTLGASYSLAFNRTVGLVITPDFFHLMGDSPSYHIDLNVGVRFSF